MRDHVLKRLDELRHQYQLGEEQLRELVRQEAALRETLLRIAGAIQVLEELLNSPAAQPAPPPPAPRETHEPLTVP